jgi:hypothetical protein
MAATVDKDSDSGGFGDSLMRVEVEVGLKSKRAPLSGELEFGINK